jgi:Outer membrane protein beta-barrel domain
MLVVLGGLVSTTAVAEGQEASLGIRGGVTIPAASYGESSVSLGTGWNIGGVARVAFGSSHFGMQLDFGYSANQIEGPPFGVVSDWQSGIGLVFMPLQMSAKVRPYVLLGAGVDYWQDNNGNGITAALYGSAGFDVRLDPIMPYAEVQYRNVLSPGSNLRIIQLIFGLRYALSYR